MAKPQSKPATKTTGKPGGKPAPSAAAKREQSRKIVNQRQTPWGLIITTVVIIAMAVGIVAFALSKGSKKKDAAVDPSKITGLITKTETGRNHVQGVVTYDATPPIGGNHNAYWADCTGTVYPNAIANENAVHALEHGAVWITYKPGLASSDVQTLTNFVSGTQYMLMSPFPDLKSNVSLQAWGHQLFVDSASDPRVQQFIATFRVNPTFTPEPNASCANADFKKNPSTFGHPWNPTAAAPHM